MIVFCAWGEYTRWKYMDGAVRITIRVRKYLWKVFVYDVCYVLYAAYMISNALSKRYVKLPITGLFLRMHRSVTRISETMNFVLTHAILIPLFILVGIAGMVYTVGVPIVLILAATGRIH